MTDYITFEEALTTLNPPYLAPLQNVQADRDRYAEPIEADGCWHWLTPITGSGIRNVIILDRLRVETRKTGVGNRYHFTVVTTSGEQVYSSFRAGCRGWVTPPAVREAAEAWVADRLVKR